jgi:hypothetical protein
MITERKTVSSEFETDVKMILYEMVEQGELKCDCGDCDCRLVVTTDF